MPFVVIDTVGGFGSCRNLRWVVMLDLVVVPSDSIVFTDDGCFS